MFSDIIFYVYNNSFKIYNYFLFFCFIWSLLELINWFIYLYIYIKIISPKAKYFKKKDVENIIKRVDKLSQLEIEYIIKGCVIYDKYNHTEILFEKFDIKDMTKKEIINLLGYSLFGLDNELLIKSNELTKIYKLLLKIENKLNHKFKNVDLNRYLYRSWGKDFIKFTFRPLFIQIIIRLVMNICHYYMIFKLKFKYSIDEKSKIGYLYKEQRDPSKKDLIFIHGFGFGYVPYIRRLTHLNLKYNLIILIIPNISSYNYYDDINIGLFPSINIIKDSFYNFITMHNITNINILSHSFGTYITQIIRNDSRANIIDKIIMVDPVIFWIGCFKASVYIDQYPVNATKIVDYIFELFLCKVVYQCLYLKYICLRVMFGPDFWIYNGTELEQQKIMLILEYNDHVIPAELLYKKIKNKKISYYYLSDALHGSVLLDHKFDNVFNNIIEYFDTI